jgi:hypothetical protein
MKEMTTASASSSKIVTPGKNKIALDSMDLCTIRQKVQEFYTVHIQVPTLQNLLVSLGECMDFQGSKEFLRRRLHLI